MNSGDATTPAGTSVYGVVVLDHSLDAHLLHRQLHPTNADILRGADISDEWDAVPFVVARRLADALVRTAPFAGNSAIVAVSAFATAVDPAEVSSLRMAYLYGTNFHQGLVFARSRRPQHIVLIAYSAPTAHNTDPGQPDHLFSFPPIPETLDLTKHELDGAVTDGVRVDAVLIEDPSRGPTQSWTGRLHEINDLITDPTFRSHGRLVHIETPANDRVIADVVKAIAGT